ncbi:MAG: hypothetical protein ACE5HJ_02990 [Thermoplasmata archaeon]
MALIAAFSFSSKNEGKVSSLTTSVEFHGKEAMRRYTSIAFRRVKDWAVHPIRFIKDARNAP